jgi:hypothetical protein
VNDLDPPWVLDLVGQIPTSRTAKLLQKNQEKSDTRFGHKPPIMAVETLRSLGPVAGSDLTADKTDIG